MRRQVPAFCRRDIRPKKLTLLRQTARHSGGRIRDFSNSLSQTCSIHIALMTSFASCDASLPIFPSHFSLLLFLFFTPSFLPIFPPSLSFSFSFPPICPYLFSCPPVFLIFPFYIIIYSFIIYFYIFSLLCLFPLSLHIFALRKYGNASRDHQDSGLTMFLWRDVERIGGVKC